MSNATAVRISHFVEHVDQTFRRAINIEHVPTFRPLGRHMLGQHLGMAATSGVHHSRAPLRAAYGDAS